jgi:hypothetical protein
MQRRKKRVLIRWTVVLILILGWCIVNPPLRFGLHCFWLTIYSCVPIPVADVRIHSNGFASFRGTKSQEITNEEVTKLIGTNENGFPDIVVIGTGYKNGGTVEADVAVELQVPIEAYPTPQAIDRFNQLRSQGKRVAAIIHTN